MPRKKRIYLDVCCLNRPFDSQLQERIRLETEAVMLILGRFQRGEQIGSETLDFEIEQMPDPERRARVRVLANAAHRYVLVENETVERAHHLSTVGFHAIDALHLACAEEGGADVFLTTDDHLIQIATRPSVQIRVAVKNPLLWLNEVLER
jgi:predicted nucleic acid-binding protein